MWGKFMIAQDRRGEQRQRTLKTGKIIFNNKTSVIDCIVRNQTNAGARLKVVSVIGIPEEFSLRIMNNPARRCRTIWRSEYELGVAFA
jgi:hypothetical protein